MVNRAVFVHQIFYDEQSKLALDSGFIPLDNTANERPDWFEFWVIRDFLRKHSLIDDGWYGFLSPKFRQKTGIPSQSVMNLLATVAEQAEVALFSPAWDQLAYFQNPFEQGEVWHPGLTEASQQFFDGIAYPVDLSSLVTHFGNSVFCNYIVAKPRFWMRWLAIANQYFDLMEYRSGLSVDRQITSYGSTAHLAPMKTFVQERIATVLLSKERFNTVYMDLSQFAPVYTRIFNEDLRTRRMLQACEVLKERYCFTNDEEYLAMFRKLRMNILFKSPMT